MICCLKGEENAKIYFLSESILSVTLYKEKSTCVISPPLSLRGLADELQKSQYSMYLYGLNQFFYGDFSLSGILIHTCNLRWEQRKANVTQK